MATDGIIGDTLPYAKPP